MDDLRASIRAFREKHGATEAPEEAAQFEAAAAAADKEKEDRQEVEKLKVSIREQLHNGTEPQYILYSALRAISLLTADPEFLEDGKAQLDSVYEDLAQRSLLNDNAIMEQKRLDAKTADYAGKLKRQLERQVKAAQKITKELEKALQEITGMEPPTDAAQ